MSPYVPTGRSAWWVAGETVDILRDRIDDSDVRIVEDYVEAELTSRAASGWMAVGIATAFNVPIGMVTRHAPPIRHRYYDVVGEIVQTCPACGSATCGYSTYMAQCEITFTAPCPACGDYCKWIQRMFQEGCGYTVECDHKSFMESVGCR